ncbi:MAG: hypothetical protein PVH87_14975 [Desulfobacteraceae bacterium]
MTLFSAERTIIIFSAAPFTAVNPTHCTDVSVAFARSAAPISFLPVYKEADVIKIGPGVFDVVAVFVFGHFLHYLHNSTEMIL